MGKHPLVGAITGASAGVGRATVPGLLDRYLGRTGYASQQADWPVEPNRPDNLYDPVPGAHDTRGDFSHLAKDRGLQWLVHKHRVAVAATAGLTAGAHGG